VLGGQATARPKSGTSTVEMIRHLKVARDTAVKSRTRAMITLKTLIVNAPAPCASNSITSAVAWR
jgi:transposase